MRINGGIPGCASQILAVTIRNMLASLGVSEALGKTEINNIDVVLLFADSNEEIVGFDISMQEMSRMYELNALKHLISEHKDGFERKFALAVVEKILKTRPKQVNDHDVVVALHTEPMDVRDSNATLKNSIELGFVE